MCLTGSSPQVRGTCCRLPSVGLRSDGGSSPQVRGTFDFDFERRLGQRLGLIPAGAGNMPARAFPSMSEHALGLIPAGAGNITGSSLGARISFAGLIPAGAGNITAPSQNEHSNWGSSPQVRGTSKVVLGLRYVHASGLIPAGAGNIHRRSHQCAVTDLAAHPRRCGEHRRGSRSARRMGIVTGLIPAGAGNILSELGVLCACRVFFARCSVVKVHVRHCH